MLHIWDEPNVCFNHIIESFSVYNDSLFWDTMSVCQKRKKRLQCKFFCICKYVIMSYWGFYVNLQFSFEKFRQKKGFFPFFDPIHWKRFDSKFYCIYTLRLLIGFKYQDYDIIAHPILIKYDWAAVCIWHQVMIFKIILWLHGIYIEWALNSIFFTFTP